MAAPKYQDIFRYFVAAIAANTIFMVLKTIKAHEKAAAIAAFLDMLSSCFQTWRNHTINLTQFWNMVITPPSQWSLPEWPIFMYIASNPAAKEHKTLDSPDYVRCHFEF